MVQTVLNLLFMSAKEARGFDPSFDDRVDADVKDAMAREAIEDRVRAVEIKGEDERSGTETRARQEDLK